MEIIEVKLKLADIYGGIMKFGMISSGAIATFFATDKSFMQESLTNRFFIFLISESIPLSLTLVSIHRFSTIEKEISDFCGIVYEKLMNKTMIYNFFISIFIVFCFVYFVS